MSRKLRVLMIAAVLLMSAVALPASGTVFGTFQGCGYGAQKTSVFYQGANRPAGTAVSSCHNDLRARVAYKVDGSWLYTQWVIRQPPHVTVTVVLADWTVGSVDDWCGHGRIRKGIDLSPVLFEC